ncbi:carboxypeptidase regulatory-like domain-containing protein [Aeromicrobium sp.]|uniref:carboxypeptidase regulatory-like domain-containing protein n=1 Tax=Aeromicrobium sp. TaxID=1871063 RepID=UPI0028AEE036|nr:carboxypeptidase regulatory-like domain-containing protein [Aeromicrobium sp.]
MSPVATPRPWARIPVVLALALAALVAPGLSGSAHAATTTLEVHVLDATSGAALDGAEVSVFATDPTADPDATAMATAVTTGDVATLDVEEGEYWVRASRAGYLPDVFQDLFTGTRWSTTFHLERDPTAVGTLTGRVLDEAGEPLSNDRGHVEIHGVALGPDSPDVLTVHTNGIGRYTAALPVGQYRVRASDDDEVLQPAWIGGASWQTARTITVSAGTTSTVPDISLRPGPSVSGRITDTSGAPIQHARVELSAGGEVVASGRTSRSGAYVIANLAPGTYTAYIHDEYGDYLGEWYDDAPTAAAARPIQVGPGDVVLNASLTPAPVVDEPGRLTGLVTDTSGVPVRAAYVTAYRRVVVDGRPRWQFPQSVLTNRSGRYTFLDLGPGSYTVRVTDEEGSEFEPQWYRGQYDERAANEIVVPADGSVTAGTMAVVHLATISGRVSRPSTPGLSDQWAWVQLFDADGRQVDEAEVAGNGTYRFRGVRAGDHTVRAGGVQDIDLGGDEHATLDLIGQWWRNAYAPGAATKLRVTSGSRLTGIDLALSATLTSVGRPTLGGTGALGTTLAASPGAWNRLAGTDFAYRWTRNGAPIAGATSARYRTTTADLGRSIAVRVTASDRYDALAAGTATSAAKVVKGSAGLAVSAKGGKRSATLRVRLLLAGVPAKASAGVVRVYDGSKPKRTMRIRAGQGTATIRGLSKGRHTFRVTFTGSGTHTAATVTKRVRVR